MSSDPQAVSTDDSAPGDLGLVRAFVNTDDFETAVEELDSPEALEAWLARSGIPPGRRLTADDVQQAIALREALRKLLLANNGAPLDAAALRTVQAAAAEAPLEVEVDAEGKFALSPGGTGVEGLAARLVAAVLRAQAEGNWDRLKACRAHDCEWAFYDHSRNRSRTWCSMDVCGNRAKTRSYRARRSRGAAR